MSIQSINEIKLPDEQFNITRLPLKLFFPHRMLIMKLLIHHKELRFHQLRDLLRTTDGNLASHLRALEQEGFITYRKSRDRAGKTYYVITPKGLDMFKKFRIQLKKTLDY
jgi:DNA-binding HxlR family transcriptional regulator